MLPYFKLHLRLPDKTLEALLSLWWKWIVDYIRVGHIGKNFTFDIKELKKELRKEIKNWKK